MPFENSAPDAMLGNVVEMMAADDPAQRILELLELALAIQEMASLSESTVTHALEKLIDAREKESSC